MVRIFTLLLVALLVESAAAHDYWLAPQTYRPAAGKPVPVRLLVGDKFDAEIERTLKKSNTVRFQLLDAKGQSVDLLKTSEEGQKPLVQLKLPQPGAYLLTLQRDWARIEMERGILAWKAGKSAEAIQGLEKSRKLFEAEHGADSFHAAALDLRVGELQFLNRDHQEALVRFRRSIDPVEEYLGPREQFVVRMRFREVSALVALGREGEAADLAREHLNLLLKVAREQDNAFLQMTGNSLNALSMKGLIPSPPGEKKSWRSSLLQAEEARDLEDSQI